MALVYVCIGVLALSWMFFVGVKFEKAKQDEKEVKNLKRAYNARNNADIEQLRKKYCRRDSV